MSQTIRFTVTDDECALIEVDAKAKGLSRSQYAKNALFSHMNKYAGKGVFAELYARLDEIDRSSRTQPTFVGSDGESDGGSDNHGS